MNNSIMYLGVLIVICLVIGLIIYVSIDTYNTEKDFCSYNNSTVQVSGGWGQKDSCCVTYTDSIKCHKIIEINGTFKYYEEI